MKVLRKLGIPAWHWGDADAFHFVFRKAMVRLGAPAYPVYTYPYPYGGPYYTYPNS
jgi:hypothetical protein